ncbi:ABC transporter ATP-binding protein [Lichenihabitans sp. Uapishka_5]|uniref:ABC transporter ATP-binding protein n=1 Tax=Lichenihabitans sp. Uapishka_5 TaxID=3037302 RepID=UPI0029E82436|nr:ABC transporter ATP-binding protein [Lichenihabitans sp. Uapishka_5]MDX7951755.1 ABC transporter ATP-binding protein [Lichenihabitans sp. Uapishka_5]
MSERQPEALLLDGVSKAYGKTWVVDRVSLTIPGGSFFSLLGPSGSGKTTLLMMIAGFVTPDGGSVRLGGRDLTPVPAEKRNFGMVFQGYALFPNMTVGENVAFSLRVRGLGRAERDARARAALDTVHLGGFEDRFPKQLSGGQQQRVALARALVFEPAVLLLDEPLSALDKKLREGLQAELREVQRRIGKTFVCVTHDQDEALSMSDRIAIVRGGRIAQEGEPDDLFENPASHFVADFLGESNFLAGDLTPAAEPGLLRWHAGATGLVQAGQPSQAGPALMALRPSKIAIASGEPCGMPNRLPGIVTGSSYRGTAIHCRVDTPAGPMSVSLPSWRAPFNPEPDQRVWLSWAPDAAVIVTDDRA